VALVAFGGAFVAQGASRGGGGLEEPAVTSAVGLVDTLDRGGVALNSAEELDAFGHYPDVQVDEDGTRYLIPLDGINWGGVAKDGIPAIDHPAYVGPDRWDQMVYDPDRLVIGVEVNGKQRAYPLQILIWHEIINEVFEGKHLLVTY
jgi:hypothetical protein